jgi:hypothetical protein
LRRVTLDFSYVEYQSFECFEDVVLSAVWGGPAGDGLSAAFCCGGQKARAFGGGRSSVLRLEERRRGFSHVAFLGSLCSGWLSSTMEELVRNTDSKDFIKSFREGSKVTIVQRGSNVSDRFLEVAVYAVGGRRGLIMVPEGREGQGWSRFAAEMSKVKVYFESMVGSSAVMLRNAG